MPASVIGGISVILNLYYLEVAMEYFNVFGTPIKAGERIDMGSLARKVTAEEKAMFTAMAKEYHANYIQVVRRGRPQVKAGASIFDGRIVSSSKALEEGLIDAVGFLPDAIERARCLAMADAVTPVMYRRHGSPTRSLYDTVPNRPLQPTAFSLNLPGAGSQQTAAVPVTVAN